MKSSEEIFNELANIMNQQFEIPLENIKLESRFYEDLNLDSIDAIDLIGQMQAILGQRINPEDFKAVLTVGDVVKAAEQVITQRCSA